MNFEWDRVKDAANRYKHGIGFTDATAVFRDPRHLIEDSTKPEHQEWRGKAIGRMGPFVVTVVFTDRDGRRRLISARRARKDERRRYDQGAATD